MNKVVKILKNEFIDGLEWYDFAFMGFGLLLQITANIINYATGNAESIGLVISGIAGVISVVLCSQKKISFFAFAYIQLFTYVFCFSIPNNLHGETIENGMYFIAMFYGIFAWAKNYKQNEKTRELSVKPRKLGIFGNSLLALIFTICVGAYWQILSTLSMFGALDSQPFVDSLTSVPAYFGQILMVLGYREQWIYWLVLDITSIILAARAGSVIMTCQFIFWSINCIYGWIKWNQENK